jgi:hypothetical protein
MMASSSSSSQQQQQLYYQSYQGAAASTFSSNNNSNSNSNSSVDVGHHAGGGTVALSAVAIPVLTRGGGILGVPGTAGIAQLREEKRHLQKELEMAHKELDRKDSRNDKLMKELLEARAAYGNHDRELKKFAGTMKRVIEDKSKLSVENAKLKESLSKAEGQLIHYNGAEAMILSMRANKDEVERCHSEVNRLLAVLDQKEEKIKHITYENDVLRRSIDIQLQYESGMKGMQNGREIMRSLCSELAKKQTG